MENCCFSLFVLCILFIPRHTTVSWHDLCNLGLLYSAAHSFLNCIGEREGEYYITSFGLKDVYEMNTKYIFGATWKTYNS